MKHLEVKTALVSNPTNAKVVRSESERVDLRHRRYIRRAPQDRAGGVHEIKSACIRPRTKGGPLCRQVSRRRVHCDRSDLGVAKVKIPLRLIRRAAYSPNFSIAANCSVRQHGILKLGAVARIIKNIRDERQGRRSCSVCKFCPGLSRGSLSATPNRCRTS